MERASLRAFDPLRSSLSANLPSELAGMKAVSATVARG
jgi:hypothetical protein